MHQREENAYLKVSFISFVLGGILGAGLTLLFAPQSGDYTRREMREKTERTIIKMQRIEDQLKNTISNLLQNIKCAASRPIHKGNDSAENKKREILEAVAAAKAKV